MIESVVTNGKLTINVKTQYPNVYFSILWLKFRGSHFFKNYFLKYFKTNVSFRNIYLQFWKINVHESFITVEYDGSKKLYGKAKYY